MTWTLARRTEAMNPSAIREILKLTERADIISFAGGLPSASTFPIEAMREASARVLAEAPQAALQYATSDGYGPLREWVAADLVKQGLRVDPSQVLITTGSQQGLDLLAKVLIDSGSSVLVETPTYLGALQAFTPMEPRYAGVACDEEGPIVDAMAEAARAARGDARFFYLLPNFQNPTGQSISAARRAALAERAAALGLPLVEDNPYGDLWFDEAPPASLASHAPGNAAYLGSFSKVLAPGLRLGYVVAPAQLGPKLLQAKQAADLHTPGFNQRVVHEVIRDGFLDRHIPSIRARYKANRDAMAAALHEYLPPGCDYLSPQGGMFFWIRLPEGLDAMALLPQAVDAGIAYVPGAAFYAHQPDARTLRLSFVTLTPELIREGVEKLGRLLHEALEPATEHAP